MLRQLKSMYSDWIISKVTTEVLCCGTLVVPSVPNYSANLTMDRYDSKQKEAIKMMSCKQYIHYHLLHFSKRKGNVKTRADWKII